MNIITTNNNSNNYKLQNIINKEKKLAAIRKDILALDSNKALDMILGSNLPATLVQSFPDQDFYFLMYRIGVDDFIPILSLGSYEQWEYIIDMDVWDGDRIDLPQMTKTLGLLFKADSKRLMRWIINEKPELLEYYFFKNMQVRIREHDEDPSDFDDGYRTIDDVFYVKFPEIPDILPDYLKDRNDVEKLKKDRQASEELILAMLNTVADMDLSVYQSILLESCSIISAEAEESQLRLKNVRLAEKGFFPHYEAVGIYQPSTLENLRKKPEKYLRAPVYGTSLPLPPQYPAGLLSNNSLFAKSLALVDDNMLLNLESEFAALVNRLISADKKTIHEKEDLEQIIKKACSFLDLGLGLIHGEKNQCLPGQGAVLIRKYWLEDIFRIASAAGIRLKRKAEKWYIKSFPRQNNLPLRFFGEKWFGLMGGLLLDRPMYFDNYKSGVLYREFACPADIQTSSENLDQLILFDRIIQALCPGITLPLNVNYKNIILTLWARNRLGLDLSLSPIPINTFKKFFEQLFAFEKDTEKTALIKTISADKRKDLLLWLSEQLSINTSVEQKQKELCKTIQPVLTELFDELEDEYGTIKPDDLDSRLISHFLLQ